MEQDEEEEEEEEGEKKWLLGPPSPMLTSGKRPEWLGLEVSNALRSQSPCKKQITFSEHRDIYRYPREDAYQEEEQQIEVEEEEEEEEEEGEMGEGAEFVEEQEDNEDDPVMEAESLLFSCEVGTSPEEEAEEGAENGLLESEEGTGPVHLEQVTVSGLRMRNRRET